MLFYNHLEVEVSAAKMKRYCEQMQAQKMQN